MRVGIKPEGVLNALLQLAKFYMVNKGVPIIKSGELPNFFFVILSGLVRYYYLAPNGKEWNKAFYHEGQLIGSLSSLLRNKPCTYTIAAIENSLVAAFPVSIFSQNGQFTEELQALLNSYIREIMLRNEEREAMLLTSNSMARYQWVLENQKWLVSRIPQYHLASYLGVEPASLSRTKRILALSKA